MENTFDIDKYNKAEFRVVTLIIIVSILSVINAANQQIIWMAKEFWSFEYGRLTFSFAENYMLPWIFRYLLLYGIYLLAHFVIIGKFVKQIAVEKHVAFCLVIFVATALIWAWSDLWLKRYLLVPKHPGQYISKNEVFIQLFGSNLITVSWYFIIYSIYNYAKYNSVVANFINEKLKDFSPVWRDVYWLAGIWLFLFLIIKGMAVLFLPIIPVYIYLSLRLIPLVKSQNKSFTNYLSRVTLIGLVISLIVIFLYALSNHHKVDTFSLIVLSIASCYVFIHAPITWAIYQHRASITAEITGLKTALGQSSANLDFLRSQINPHFLFNALNTLYGTAIQESADRTGEGIQKLGDMMRFMLHENIQEKISLMREVDYLKNYIDLQKLRTHTSPDIVIQTEIEESVNGLQIAPMLLIPFVENAFKHGISLREASHIKIALHTEGLKLYFDVYNSVHPKTGIDPEKHNTGIGLQNVKQRLQLLYPDRHELMIRETTKEFFVHLTVQL